MIDTQISIILLAEKVVFICSYTSGRCTDQSVIKRW